MACAWSLRIAPDSALLPLVRCVVQKRNAGSDGASTVPQSNTRGSMLLSMFTEPSVWFGKKTFVRSESGKRLSMAMP